MDWYLLRCPKRVDIIMEKNQLLKECAEALKEQNLTLAFAESVTAGCLCHAFGALPDCGSFFKGGIVVYDAEIKKSLLGLTQEMLDEFTPESAEVSQALAQGLASLIPADCLIGVTGLNTSGGSETPEKPVGTIFIHAIVKGKEYAVEKRFNGDAEAINNQVLTEVCSLLKKVIEK